MKLLIRLTSVLMIVLMFLLVVTVGINTHTADVGCYSFTGDNVNNPSIHTFIGSSGGSQIYSAAFNSRRTLLATSGTLPNAKVFYQVGDQFQWLYAQDANGTNTRRMRETALSEIVNAADWS